MTRLADADDIQIERTWIEEVNYVDDDKMGKLTERVSDVNDGEIEKMWLRRDK